MRSHIDVAPVTAAPCGESPSSLAPARQLAKKRCTIAAICVFLVVFPLLENYSNSTNPVGTTYCGVVVTLVWMIESCRSLPRVSVGLQLLAALVLLFACSSLWSRNPEYTTSALYRLAQMVVLYWIVFDVCRDAKQIRRVLHCYALGMGMLTISALPAILTGTFSAYTNRYSADGTDPNNFGIMVASSATATVGLSSAGSFLTRLLARAYLLLAMFVCLATGSRSTLLALALAAIAYRSLQVQRRQGFALLAASALLLCAFIGFAVRYLPQGPLTRLFTQSGGLENFDDRLTIWRVALEKGAEHPFIGSGGGTSQWVLGMEAHNSFVKFFFELGVIGLALWSTVWMVGTLQGTRNKTTEAKAICLALVPSALVVATASLTLNWEFRKPLYVLWALSAAVSALSPESEACDVEGCTAVASELRSPAYKLNDEWSST